MEWLLTQFAVLLQMGESVTGGCEPGEECVILCGSASSCDPGVGGEGASHIPQHVSLQVQVAMVGAKANLTSGEAPVVRVQLKHAGVSYLFDNDLNKWVCRRQWSSTCG